MPQNRDLGQEELLKKITKKIPIGVLHNAAQQSGE